MRRAAAPPDRQHPLGYGRELYFWSFVVALLIFALGAGVAIYEGVVHIGRPEPIQNVSVVYVVLALSALFDGATWWAALRSFKGGRPYAALYRAVRESKDPPSFMVLFEDSAALIGIAIALCGTFFSTALEWPALDGLASILIGIVLALTALALAVETKGLLIGESADPSMVAGILRRAASVEGVAHANGALTVHLAPDQILVALSVEFADELTTPMIEARVLELERRLRAENASITTLFVKPQTQQTFNSYLAQRYGQNG